MLTVTARRTIYSRVISGKRKETAMDEIDDGGPASAKSLRDEFAGKAMAAMLVGNDDDFIDPEWIGVSGKINKQLVAERSYAFADAMLAARSRPGETP